MANENGNNKEEHTSTSDGALDDAKGRVKKAVGAITGNRDLEREGEVDRAAGEAKRAAGAVVDKVKEGVSSLLGSDDSSKD